MILISQHLTGFANFFTRFYKQDINKGERVVNSDQVHFKSTYLYEVRSSRKEKSREALFAIAPYLAKTRGLLTRIL